MPNTYRVAIIGCGGIAREHANGWRRHPACTIVAVADINAGNATKLAGEFEIPTIYAEYRQLLEKERPDIVSVCTWPGTHAEITIAAAEAGAAGILCEKPMARSLAEVDAMLAACDEQDVRLAIAHNRRYWATSAAARAAIADGAIGEPTLLHAGTGGGLTNNGSHVIDFMRFLLGDPETAWVIGQVERRTDRWERAQPIEDLCGGIIAFASGARGIIETDLPEPKRPGGTLVYGTEGVLRVDRTSAAVQNAAAAGWQPLETPPRPNEFESLVQWIEGRGEHPCTGRHVRPTVEIMMGLYESARTRGVVRMPLPSGPSPLDRMIEDGTLPVVTPGKYDIRL
jgi:predicted dehydrogenase